MTQATRNPKIAVLRSRIVARARECIDYCEPLCAVVGVRLPTPDIRFDLRGSTAGQCVWRDGHRPLLRFNLDLAAEHADAFVTTTVAHEVAHLVTIACHDHATPHGPHWRAVMFHLGIDNPQRCHNYAVSALHSRRQRRWTYHCGCREHQLSTTRHNRIQRRDAGYICRNCGNRLRRAIGPDNAL